jgi:hypothetical protein
VPRVIERFAVPPGEDEAFLAAWRASGDPGAVLLRALRDDAPHRYVAVSEPLLPDVDGGVWRIAPPGEPQDGRQGFLGARAEGDVELQRWSSPLMVQRAGLGGALYVAA